MLSLILLASLSLGARSDDETTVDGASVEQEASVAHNTEAWSPQRRRWTGFGYGALGSFAGLGTSALIGFGGICGIAQGCRELGAISAALVSGGLAVVLTPLASALGVYLSGSIGANTSGRFLYTLLGGLAGTVIAAGQTVGVALLSPTGDAYLGGLVYLGFSAVILPALGAVLGYELSIPANKPTIAPTAQFLNNGGFAAGLAVSF